MRGMLAACAAVVLSLALAAAATGRSGGSTLNCLETTLCRGVSAA